jgi:uncharacterized protein
MVKLKTSGVESSENEIIYSEAHWTLLKSLRTKALVIVGLFHQNGLETLTYGSIARGDIKISSDIDIFLKQQIPSYRIELILEGAGIQILEKKIIQATPNDVVKGHFILPDDICLTFYLSNLGKLGLEFYNFGGSVSYQELTNDDRKPGINKQLILIEPTEKGHIESLLMDKQFSAADILKVSQKMIDQRIRVLNRRDKVGRTGVFINQSLDVSENVEEKLREMA